MICPPVAEEFDYNRVGGPIQVRKYFCKNTDCPRMIFIERFATGLASYARRFERLNQVITGIGLESGGNSTTRQAHSFSVKISASTVLRLIKKCSIPHIISPKIIGSDRTGGPAQPRTVADAVDDCRAADAAARRHGHLKRGANMGPLSSIWKPIE